MKSRTAAHRDPLPAAAGDCQSQLAMVDHAEHMRTSLVIDALAMARDHGHLADDAVFHSDRGAQNTSSEFSRYCREISVLTTLGRIGVCWDNAAADQRRTQSSSRGAPPRRSGSRHLAHADHP